MRRDLYHAGPIRWTLGLVAALALTVALAACGGAASITAASGTITGDVEAGPTCPVEQVENPCPPKPVTNREVKILSKRGQIVATTTTDAQGHFSVAVAPGDYVVAVAIVSGQVGMRQSSPGDVSVASGQPSYIKIELDTGIR
jgi:hypothetical protein